jgi:FkbM family methyltransferase
MTEMLIPDDMIEACGHVFAGEYDINYDKKAPVILDIGANVGAFTRWARHRWPDSIVYAYEPLPDCMRYLIKNTDGLKGVFVTQCAIGSVNGTRTLYHGTENRGMSSFEKSDYTRDSGTEVNVKSAFSLPKADIVKCDTEGSEVEILQCLQFKPDVILVEYHSLEAKMQLLKMYDDEYTLFEYKLMSLRCGNLKFVKNSAMDHIRV